MYTIVRFHGFPTVHGFLKVGIENKNKMILQKDSQVSDS